jgi:hypothetical protein
VERALTSLLFSASLPTEKAEAALSNETDNYTMTLKSESKTEQYQMQRQLMKAR